MNKHPNDDTPATDLNSANSSLLRYRIILIVLFPILIGFSFVQALKYRSAKYFLQRLGFNTGLIEKIDVWIHATSVGEVNAAVPLVHAIRNKYKNVTILVTTTTPTGARVIESKKIPNTQHCYLPIDYVTCVSSFLKKMQPHCAIIMETEIWPNLFRLCHKFNIPLYTVNGRLSQRTLNTKQWIKSLYASTLQYSSLILTRSDNDSKAYIALGAHNEKVKTIGNIKFSTQFSPPETQEKFTRQPFVLAASTHDDEELQIATLWNNNRDKFANYLLVIAPRHPHRLKKILDQLRPLGLNIAIRSRQQAVTDTTDIYIVDTVGELVNFMNDAQLVFMGGSLVTVGGHNVIEPANLAKAVIFGPYMANFEDEANLLLTHQAAIQVEDAEQLIMTMSELLLEDNRRIQLGDKARELMETQKDVADRYVAELQQCLEK